MVKEYSGKMNLKNIQKWAKKMGVCIQKSSKGFESYHNKNTKEVVVAENLTELVQDVCDLAAMN